MASVGGVPSGRGVSRVWVRARPQRSGCGASALPVCGRAGGPGSRMGTRSGAGSRALNQGQVFVPFSSKEGASL